MSGNRKFIRDQVRKHIKQAKKNIPAHSRDLITFSQVFKLVKNESKITQQNTNIRESVRSDISVSTDSDTVE